MKSAVKILYLTHDGLTDPLGQSQILPYLTGLSRQGFSITILSFEKKENYETNNEVIWEICNELKIQWVPMDYHRKPPVLSTLFDLYRLHQKARILHKENTFTIVHCRSYVTALVGVLLKRKFGLKFIFDMRGFWPDERVESGLWNTRNPLYKQIYRFFKKKEEEFIRQADSVIVLTEAARKFISRRFPSTRVTVIPCCVDLHLFNPARITYPQVDRLRNDLGIGSSDYVLLYLGSLGTWYMVNEMFAFFRRIQERDPSAKFLVLTPDRHLVPAGDGIITLTVPRSQVPAYIALCTASVCFIRPSFSKSGSSATKMAEVLAMQVPVFTNEGWGDIEYLSRVLPGVLVVEPDCQPEVSFPVKPPLTGRFTDMFSLESGVRKYTRIYKDLSQDALNK